MHKYCITHFYGWKGHRTIPLHCLFFVVYNLILDSPDLANYDDAEELRGFDLSPAHGFEQSHTEDTEMYQPVTQVVRTL